ncbi:MAG: HAMP domain-containing histidine kinase [Acidimicrobiia bacterium]|nr:HAMP domain-containing histidine kinase [Acidimicrobiia bacterium]
MSDVRRAWYRSLYWRIALGLLVFLALMLAAQSVLFLFMTDRLAGSMPARTPRQLAVLAASDLATALAQNPDLDVESFVTEQYARVFQAIVIAFTDGRTFANHPSLVPDGMPATLGRLAQLPEPRRRGDEGARGGQGGDRPFRRRPAADGPAALPPDQPAGRTRFEFRGPPPGAFPRVAAALRGRADFAPVVVNGARVGLVAVPLGRPPFTLVLRELGPSMALVGVLVLGAGGTMVAFVVFGPARRRLRQLQTATEQVAAGDLRARAPAGGGDEVAELARSFNRMAEELAARASALEASDQARRQLLADVSHELMTPLTAMRGYLETLSMRELALDQPTRDRYLAIAGEETGRLERIIGDLLDLARLEGGSPDMRTGTVDVAALFARVAERHERELGERRITLSRAIDAAAATVSGDADRLEQALQNLAGNALRHTPDGGAIDLRSERRGDRVLLSVRDSGPGIPADTLPLIFDRFFKADASRHGGGSGLGLSIVKAIVERHAGTITARNDDGAVFEISLPAARPA